MCPTPVLVSPMFPKAVCDMSTIAVFPMFSIAVSDISPIEVPVSNVFYGSLSHVSCPHILSKQILQ